MSVGLYWANNHGLGDGQNGHNTIQYHLIPASTPILTYIPVSPPCLSPLAAIWFTHTGQILFTLQQLPPHQCSQLLLQLLKIYKPACQLYPSSDTAILCLPPVSAHVLGHFLLLHNLSGALPPSQANMKSYPPPPHPTPSANIHTRIKNSPYSASTHAVGKHHGLVDVVGEDGGTQTVGGAVGALNGLLHRAELQ